jgi:hypothetical protein
MTAARASQDRQSSLARGFRSGPSRQKPAWLMMLDRANRETFAAARLGSRCATRMLKACPRDLRFVFRVARGLQIAQARLNRAARHIDRAEDLSSLNRWDAEAASWQILMADGRVDLVSRILELLFAVEPHEVLGTIHALAKGSSACGRPSGASAEAFDYELPSIELTELELLRASLRPDGSVERERLRRLRRRRSTWLRSVNAPRRISRGRAPPPASTCQL